MRYHNLRPFVHFWLAKHTLYLVVITICVFTISLNILLGVTHKYQDIAKVESSSYLQVIDEAGKIKQQNQIQKQQNQIQATVAANTYIAARVNDQIRLQIEQEQMNTFLRLSELIAIEKQKFQSAGMIIPTTPRPGYKKLIYASIAAQYLYIYEEGYMIYSTPIISGMDGFETVTGEYNILRKETDTVLKSPFPNIKYDVFVSYWMPFYSGYGIHDAPWRGSTFGLDIDHRIYGSHGCFNTPPVAARWIWDWVEIGTPIVIVGE